MDEEDFDGTSQAFLAWLRTAGADISPKLELKDLRSVEAGRGVVATEDVEEDELLFRVPRSAILSVENSILSQEIPQATFEHLGPWLSLILVMLYEYLNGNSSHWEPYFRVLPQGFNTLMFWESDELAQLQGSAVLQKIGKEGADEAFKTQLVPVIKEFAHIFFSGDESAKERSAEMLAPHNTGLMHRMGTLIMAYAFDIESANAEKDVDEDGYVSEDEEEALPKGMVPLADLLNADADRNNARLFYEEHYLSMKALVPIQAGAEIFNDYGPLPRSDLLRRYGYITANYAQYDVVEISEETIANVVEERGLSNEERMGYLDEHGILDTGYDISAASPFNLAASLAPELVILIETLALPETEFDRLKRKGKLPKSEQITQESASLLLAIVRARMREYATSLEADLAATEDEAVAGLARVKAKRYALAKAVRVGEKVLLTSVEEELARRAGEEGTLKRAAAQEPGASKKQRRL